LPRHISALLPCVNEQEEDDNGAGSSAIQAERALQMRSGAGLIRRRIRMRSKCSISLGGTALAGSCTNSEENEMSAAILALCLGVLVAALVAMFNL
jgi:hypothetical protein